MDDGYNHALIINIAYNLTAAAVLKTSFPRLASCKVDIVFYGNSEFALQRSFPIVPCVEGFPYNVR